MNEQPPFLRVQDAEHVDRLIDKHERFMDLAMAELLKYLAAKKITDFEKLPSNQQHILLNDFLIKMYPDAQLDFRKKLKIELLKIM